MNRVVLMGRLTKDPDIRYSQGAEGQMCVARFSLAVDRRKHDEADFISCVAFGKTAETIEKYLKKGTKIAIEGHIQTGSYTNQQGTKIYTTDVVVDSMEFAESKSNQNGQAPITQPQTDEYGFMSIPFPDSVNDEGLPF